MVDRVSSPPLSKVGHFKAGGLSHAFEDAGSGPLVVLLPALGFSRETMRPLADRLAPFFRCLSLDARGVGGSEAPPDDAGYDVDKQAADVLALLDHVGADGALLLGHSAGCNIAIAATLIAPERILGLTLLCPSLAPVLVNDHLDALLRAAPAEVKDVIERVEARGPVFVAGQAPPDDYAAAVGAVYADKVLRAPLDPALAAMMQQAPGAARALWGADSAFRITGSLARVDQRDSLPEVRCPVLVVTGEGDGYAASTLPLLREGLTHVRVVELEGSLHHPNLEEPWRVADEMAAYFDTRANDDLSAEAAAPTLRPGVTLERDDDGDLVIEDTSTGYRFAVGELAASIVEALPRTADEVAGLLAATLEGDYEIDDVREEVLGFFGHLRQLGLFAEGLPLDEVERRQRTARLDGRAQERFEEVREAVRFVYEKVPLHKQRLEAAGVHPDELESAEDLARVPVMTKADLRRNFPDGLVPEGTDVAALIRDGVLTVGATSGTTDERLQVLFDFSAGTMPERAPELWRLSDEDASLQSAAVFTSPICAGFECHLGASSREARTRGATLTLNSCDDVMSITDEEVRAIAREANEHRPDVLFTNPWYAVWLARRLRALGLSFPPLKVLLSSYQFLTRRHRRLLREGFGAPVFSYYGATDLGGALIGADCASGFMHLREDQCHVELAPIGGGADGLGSVLVTTLKNKYMPLLRYDVGDLARAMPGACDCALGTEWRRVRVEGRKKDVVASPSGRLLTTAEIDDAVGDADVDFYRFVQTGKARYRLEAMPADDGDVGAAVGRLSALLGEGADVSLQIVERLSPERSLKFRQTMSEVLAS